MIEIFQIIKNYLTTTVSCSRKRTKCFSPSREPEKNCTSQVIKYVNNITTHICTNNIYRKETDEKLLRFEK